jgi:hypothetical protein
LRYLGEPLSHQRDAAEGVFVGVGHADGEIFDDSTSVAALRKAGAAGGDEQGEEGAESRGRGRKRREGSHRRRGVDAEHVILCRRAAEVIAEGANAPSQLVNAGREGVVSGHVESRAAGEAGDDAVGEHVGAEGLEVGEEG